MASLLGSSSLAVGPHHPTPGLWAPTLMSHYQVPGHLLISSLLRSMVPGSCGELPSCAAWNFIWLWRPDNQKWVQPRARALKPFVVKDPDVQMAEFLLLDCFLHSDEKQIFFQLAAAPFKLL